MEVLDLCGWIGSFFFSICAFPQAWLSYKQGHSEGFSHTFAWIWFSAEVFMIIYSAGYLLYPVLINCLFNTAALLIIMRYLYFPRNKSPVV